MMAKANGIGAGQTLRTAGEARNDHRSSQHHGCVGGHRMHGKVVGNTSLALL